MKSVMNKNSKKNHANGKHKKNNKTDSYRLEEDNDATCCFCVKLKRNHKKSLIAGCITNLGIFFLLLVYTLLGAVVFLAIEGNSVKIHQKTLATTSYQINDLPKSIATDKANVSISQATAELRSQTVESIWEITVSLNILYKENWTRLAAQEIARFQEKLAARISADVSAHYTGAKTLESAQNIPIEHYEWNFAKSFLYSLTVLTTIGYGNVAPKTSLGKAITIGYAVVGIPLTLLYLSVVGALLSRLARSIFSRSLCCCICIKSGHCCFDERAIAIKERKDKFKHQEDYRNHLQEPYYVRSPSGTIISASQANSACANTMKEKTQSLSFLRDCDSMSCTDTDSKISLSGFSILAPISLCLAAIFTYIFFGALVLYHLESWTFIDGVYFCFMSLSTIGFGHLVPGGTQNNETSNGTVWFCSVYIITGLALTAMCFNVLHDEIVHRLRHHDKLAKVNNQKILNPEFLHRS